jgi:hypothetical protein
MSKAINFFAFCPIRGSNKRTRRQSLQHGGRFLGNMRHLVVVELVAIVGALGAFVRLIGRTTLCCLQMVHAGKTASDNWFWYPSTIYVVVFALLVY